MTSSLISRGKSDESASVAVVSEVGGDGCQYVRPNKTCDSLIFSILIDGIGSFPIFSLQENLIISVWYLSDTYGIPVHSV